MGEFTYPKMVPLVLTHSHMVTDSSYLDTRKKLAPCTQNGSGPTVESVAVRPMSQAPLGHKCHLGLSLNEEAWKIPLKKAKKQEG